jgi:hypothetical protein
VRPVDGGPATHIDRSEGVGRPSEAAADAPEMRWVQTIAPVDQPTLWARPGRIPGIDQHDWHPSQSGLVLKKGAELMERPAMLATPLRLLNRDPVADARQIFQGDTAPRVLGFRHPLCGHAVVDRGGKPLCLAPPFLESALR